jgi:hypothetical protein
MDEGYTTLATTQLLASGNTILPSGMDYQCGLYCQSVLPLAKNHGINEKVMRSPAAVASVLCIVVVFALGRRLFSTRVALIAAFITTFSYWQIAWSRQARWYSFLELFFWLAILFGILAIHSTKRRMLYGVLALLSTALAVWSSSIALLLPLILFGMAMYDPHIRARALEMVHAPFTRKHLIFLVSALTALIYVVVRLLPYVLNISISPTPFYYIEFYAREYLFFLPFVAVAFLTSSYTHRRAAHILLCCIALYLLPLSVFGSPIAYRYFFHMTPAIILLTALGIDTFLVLLKSLWARGGVVVLLLLSFFLAPYATSTAGVLVPKDTYALESDLLDRGASTYHVYTPQPDWNLAYETIREMREKNDIIISSHPHMSFLYTGEPGYWFPMDYGLNTPVTGEAADAHDPYVGALPVSSREDLIRLRTDHHGFIIFDAQARDGRMPEDLLSYIDEELEQVLYYGTNQYSKIWVYRF